MPSIVSPAIIFSTRTNHVVKAFNLSPPSPPTFATSFGTFGVPGSGGGGLNFPWGVAVDGSNNYYICDHENQRIVKLNSAFSYVGQYDSSSTIGRPCSIFFDSGNLYFCGLRYYVIESNMMYIYLGIEKITTSLTSVKYNNDLMGLLNRMDYTFFNDKPLYICFGSSGEIVIGGFKNTLYTTTENVSGFTTAVIRSVISLPSFRLFGMMFYNNTIYLNVGPKIVKINSSYIKFAESSYQSRSLLGITKTTNGLLVYDAYKKAVIRFSDDLNYIEDVVVHSGNTLQTDVTDVMGFVQI